jgi:ribose-phosphate pyrophosphokinase
MPWTCRIDFRIGEEGDLFIKSDLVAIGGPSVGAHGIPKICIEATGFVSLPLDRRQIAGGRLPANWQGRDSEVAEDRDMAVTSDGKSSGPMVFAIGASAEFGRKVCRHLGTDLAPLEERDFEDGEHKIRPLASVRNRDVYVIHSLAGDEGQSANDKLCRMLFLIGALKDAAAGRITAVAPYLCYARKDRQTKTRDPLTSRYVAQLFEAVSTDRMVTMEVHNPAAYQNAFRCDTEHLDANQALIDYFAPLIGERPLAVVSPDPGGVKRADIFREDIERALGRPVAAGFMEKHRSMGKVTGDIFAGDVAGRDVIVIDDLISTGGTMARVAAACRDNGAAKVYLAATHGLFAEQAGTRLAAPPVDRIVVTNTVARAPQRLAEFGDRLVVVDVATIFAGAIRRCHDGDSINELLGRKPPL